MKKAITVIAAIVVLAVPATASAEWAGQGNSTPGIDRYKDIAANPNPEAQCGTGAGSGAFGYYGVGSNLGQTRQPDPGANGPQTGINNSAVCGNRQGNLP